MNLSSPKNLTCSPKQYAFIAAMILLLLSSTLSRHVEAQEPETTDTQSEVSNEPQDSSDKATEKPDASKSTRPPRIPSHQKRYSAPTNQQAKMQLLADQLHDQEPQWIDSEEGSFLAIWRKDRSGDAKGAILIIHAEGEHPSWPKTTKPLHDTLPDYGWATMAISLPELKKHKIPARTLPVKTLARKNSPESTESAKNPEQNKQAPANTPTVNETTSSPQPIEQLFEERLTASLQFLHKKGQFNIVIMGSSTSAIRAHQFIESITPKVTDEKLKERIEKPIRALIIYNARNQLTPTDKPYQQWFSDPEIPVLDIYTKVDRRNAKEAQQRKILSQQKGAQAYSKVKLGEIAYEKSWGENRLSRRIRSFLDAYLRGIEVDGANIKEDP